MTLAIRKATQNDAPFIAQMVMTALHLDPIADQAMCDCLTNVVRHDDTLYAWDRCYIACYGEECVGLCLAYDAIDYHERRIRTFSFPSSDGKSFADKDPSLLEQEDEAGEGEYYIDSLAVTACHRKKGIGRKLLKHAINIGIEKKLHPTLLVDPANENAVKLYSSLGFAYDSDMFAFGQIYHKYRYKKQ